MAGKKLIVLLVVLVLIVLSVLIVYGVSRITSGGSDKALPVGGGEIIVKNSTNGLFTATVDGNLATSDVQIARSIDYGTTWNISLVDANPGVVCATDLSLIINSSDALHLFCSKDALIHWYSIDSGTTWTSGEHIYDDDGVDFATAIVDGNDNIFVCYYNESGTGEIRVANSSRTNTNSTGGVWGNSRIERRAGGAPRICDIEADGNNNIHLVYHKFDVVGNLSYANLTAGGNWGIPRNITAQENVNSNPSIVITSTNNISVAWVNVAGAQRNLSYANSSDGVTWSVNQTITTPSDIDSTPISLIRDVKDNMFIFQTRTRFLNLTANSSIFSGWSRAYEIPYIFGDFDLLTARGSSYPGNNSYANITNSIDYVYVASNETPDQIYYDSYPIGSGDTVEVILRSPLTGLATINTTINFNCTASTNLGRNIDNVTFLLWDSDVNLEASTFRNLPNAPTQSENFTITSIIDDSYRWNCEYTDVENLRGYQATNNTLTIDTVNPLLNLIGMRQVYNNISVQVNYTINDSNPSLCTYSLNGGITNTSFGVCGTNATITANAGNNELTVFVNDTAGNSNRSDFNFTSVIFLQQVFNNNMTLEGSSENYDVLITNQSATMTSGRITYNGTTSDFTSFTSNATTMNVTRRGLITQNLPTAIRQFNNTFFWNFTFQRGDDFVNISDLSQQELYQKYLDNCNLGVTTTLSVNYTIRDEETNRLLNGTFSHLYSPLDANGNAIRTFNFTDGIGGPQNSSSDVCIFPSWGNFTANTQVHYSVNSSYDERDYIFGAQRFDNATRNVVLLLLASSTSTDVIINVRDQNDNVLEGYTVQAYKFDVVENDFDLVQTGITDFSGKTLFQLDNTQTYRFIISLDGVEKLRKDNIRIIGANPELFFTIIIGPREPIEDVIDVSNFSASLYNSSFNTFNLSWGNLGTQLTQVCLRVNNHTATHSNQLSYQCSTTNFGNLSFIVHNGSQFLGTAFAVSASGSSHPVGTLILNLMELRRLTFRDTVDDDGIFFTLMIVGVLGGIGLSTGNPAITVILTVFGLAISYFMGFTAFSTVGIMALIVMGVIVAIKLRS